MGTLRGSVLAAAILTAHLATAASAPARVCITVTVFIAGQPTPSGPHCQPLLDKRGEEGLHPEVAQDGYGARLELSYPLIP